MFDSAGVGWGEPLTEAARRVYSSLVGVRGQSLGPSTRIMLQVMSSLYPLTLCQPTPRACWHR